MNPYKNLPPESFWKNFKKNNFNLEFFVDESVRNSFNPKKIASAGSCFAANVAIHLQNTSTEYLHEEVKHPFVSSFISQYNYESYSARYGNVYSSRQFLQLVKRAKGNFTPNETIWKNGKEIKDPFRPGLDFKGFTEDEFLLDNEIHLKAVKRVITNCDTFIFTLGLSEVWMNKEDKAAYPSCPGTIAGIYDPNKYELTNLNVEQIITDLNEVNSEMTEINPNLKFLLTVSPVPMVATANSNNIVLSNQYAKSKLIVAAHETAAANANMQYFPSFEMIIGSHANSNFLEDKRNVKPEVVKEVMKIFKYQYNIKDLDKKELDENTNISKYINNECEELAYEMP